MKKSLMMKILGVVAVVMMLSLVDRDPSIGEAPSTGPWGAHQGDRDRRLHDRPTLRRSPDGWVFTSQGTGQMSHLGRVDYFLTQDSDEFFPEKRCSSPSAAARSLSPPPTATHSSSNIRSCLRSSETSGWTSASRWKGRGPSLTGKGPGASRTPRRSGSIDGIGFIDPYGPAGLRLRGRDLLRRVRSVHQVAQAAAGQTNSREAVRPVAKRVVASSSTDTSVRPLRLAERRPSR